MRYEIVTLDTSADGMERLRNQDEFILLAYGDSTSTPVGLIHDWKADVQSCDRGDGFDYAAIDAALDAISFDALTREIMGVGRSPKDAAEEALKALEEVNRDAHDKLRDVIATLEEIAADDENGSATFRLYVRDTKGGDAD